MIPEDFKVYYIGLTTKDRQAVIEGLLRLQEDSSLSLTDNSNPLACPHCENKHVVANGKNPKGTQRYLCRGCNKVFNSSTGKVWYQMHKRDKLAAYLNCLLLGYSIRKCATEVGISKHTAFVWRHKLLTSFSQDTITKFKGIVESDETYFLFSEKGRKDLERKPRKRGNAATKDGINDEHVAVLVTLDRSGNKEAKVVRKGRITKEDVRSILKNKIQKGSVLCTDGHPSYVAFAKRIKVDHKKIIVTKGQKVVENRYHLQNVNSLDSRLKKFILKFNGVSSRYLQNYINWFLTLEKIKHSTTKFFQMSAMVTSSTNAWPRFRELYTNHSQIGT